MNLCLAFVFLDCFSCCSDCILCRDPEFEDNSSTVRFTLLTIFDISLVYECVNMNTVSSSSTAALDFKVVFFGFFLILLEELLVFILLLFSPNL